MIPFSEAKIVSGFRNAESDVLKFIYQEYLPAVIHMVKTNNGAPIDAEDIFQDALVILFEKIQTPGFTLNCTLKTFLYAVCRNLWLHRLEKLKRESVTCEIMENFPGAYLDVDRNYLEADKEKLYQSYFLQLGQNCQKILSLVFKRYTTSEIARVLGLESELYVRKRKSQCRKKLIRSIMKDPRYKMIKNQYHEQERP